MKSFIISLVDYCNSLLAGAPSCLTDRVQSVLNAAARLIYGRGRYEHVTDLIRDRLHWLPVHQRIRFKYGLLAYKGINGLAPTYIAEFCTKKDTTLNHYRLRSSTSTSDNLTIPVTKTRFGERSFAVAGPTVWNALPNNVKNAESLDTFKKRLKTHLFKLAYDI